MGEAGTRLKALHASNKGDPHLVEVMVNEFMAIRENFHPVLRHFFTEVHKVPMAWFEMRLKYARSVATNSIVGHVVGLGDRHISNILIDKVSGELVHIDFGIAFDQVIMVMLYGIPPLTCHPLSGKAVAYTREGTIPIDGRHCRWAWRLEN